MHPNSSIHWNAYPSTLAALCLAAGIVAADVVDLPLFAWTAMGCLVTMLGMGALRPSGLIGPERGRLLVCAFGCVFALGAVRQTDYVDPAGSAVSLLPVGMSVELFGRPRSAARTASGVRFFLAVDSVRASGGLRASTGSVQVYVRDASPEDIDPCRGITVSGRLDALPSARNPGEFDYGRYLRGRRVFIRLFADAESVVVGASRGTTSPPCVAHKLKSRIERQFDRTIHDPAARAVILALVVGDRSGIDDETEVLFRRTGLLHLLAVSGLHVLVVGMILYHLLRPILLRCGLSWRAAEWARSVATTVLLSFYALVTGLPASVVRAVVMATLFMAGSVCQRSSHSLNTLGVAVIVLLIARPAQLFEPGFQLSVAAVAAIISLQSRFASALPGDDSDGVVRRSLRSSTSVSLAAATGTLPVLLYHFGSVSFAGLFLNTFAVPLTSATLASSVTTAGISGLSEPLGDVFGTAAQFFAQFLLYVVERGETYFRWAYVEWSVDDATIIGALIVGIFAIAQWPRPRMRWRLFALALAISCAAVIGNGVRGGWKPTVSALFLDVGQGDATLFTFPNGRTMLVDAGPRTAYSDAGLYTILPQLQKRRIHRLDVIVVTHPDSDHLGGLPTLLRNVEVGRILHCGIPHDSRLYVETIDLIDSLRIPYRHVRAGDTLVVDATTRIHVLHPDRPKPTDKPNASSVVMRVQYDRTAFLMMGDAEEEAERLIVRRYGRLLDPHVIKVGHHGSETSSSSLLTSRILRNDVLAVVSVGRGNRYGLPDSSVMRRLARSGMRVKRTDQQGAVWLESDGRRLTERRWR